MKNTLTQLDMPLVNHVSATKFPETVPAFTAFMNMKNEGQFLGGKWNKIPKNKQVKRLLLDCINVCVKMFYSSPNMWNQVKIECWNFS